MVLAAIALCSHVASSPLHLPDPNITGSLGSGSPFLSWRGTKSRTTLQPNSRSSAVETTEGDQAHPPPMTAGVPSTWPKKRRWRCSEAAPGARTRTESSSCCRYDAVAVFKRRCCEKGTAKRTLWCENEGALYVPLSCRGTLLVLHARW